MGAQTALAPIWESTRGHSDLMSGEQTLEEFSFVRGAKAIRKLQNGALSTFADKLKHRPFCLAYNVNDGNLYFAMSCRKQQLARRATME
eukprot:1138640-Pelagomonas_calceolata.AAC.4